MVSPVRRLREDWQKVSDLLRVAEKALTFHLSDGEVNILTAIIIAEDHRFFSHRGVDPRSMIRAIFRTVLYRRVEGASTIEQQLVRTVRARFEYSISRKFTECLLAVALSQKFQKQLIVRTYAYVAYFGWKANGLVQASRRLGIDIDRADRRESATLAAMLKVPMPRAPSEKYKIRIERRVNYILKKWGEFDRSGDRFKLVP